MPSITSGGDSVTGANIVDETISNADISPTAAIDRTKVSGAAASGANSDITSLTALSTPLTEAQGGTEKANMMKRAVGAMAETYAKTWFNVQLLFILWTGGVVNDTTTTFANWVRSSSDYNVSPGGAYVFTSGTGADLITLDNFIKDSATTSLQFNGSGNFSIDFFMKLAASNTGDMRIGFGDIIPNSFNVAYNANSSGEDFIGFAQSAAGALYAVAAKFGAGVTATDISSGLTLTNWNHYRIEVILGTSWKLYVNGVLKATLSGANVMTPATTIKFGAGRSNTASVIMTAPNLSYQLI